MENAFFKAHDQKNKADMKVKNNRKNINRLNKAKSGDRFEIMDNGATAFSSLIVPTSYSNKQIKKPHV